MPLQITSGLNHVAHLAFSPRKFEVGTLEQDIIDAKLNPYDENITGRSGELMEKVKSIKKIVNAIKSRKGVVNVKEVTELQAAGQTDPIDFSVAINLNSFNNCNLLGFAYTLGHELIHSFDWQFNMVNWKDDYGSTASRGKDLHAWRELRAYDWNIRMGMKLQGQQIGAYDGFKSTLDNSKTFQTQQLRFRTINPW